MDIFVSFYITDQSVEYKNAMFYLNNYFYFSLSREYHLFFMAHSWSKFKAEESEAWFVIYRPACKMQVRHVVNVKFCKSSWFIKFYFCLIFMSYLVAPLPTLGNYWGDSLAYSILITVFPSVFYPKVTNFRFLALVDLQKWKIPSPDVYHCISISFGPKVTNFSLLDL